MPSTPSPVPASPTPAVVVIGTSAVAALMLALASVSPPRAVGDGLEYVTMARQLARGRLPSVTPDELAAYRVGDRQEAGLPDVSLVRPTLVGRDGRQDFHHFWLYPLLAAPGVWLAERAHFGVVRGFLWLNLALLLSTAPVLARRFGWASTALVLLGPLTWWVDKPHTEVATVCAIALSVAWAGTRPIASAAVAGLATAQNPAVAPVTVLVLITAARGHAWRTAAAASAVALAFASIHPLYYLVRLGTWSPLASVTGRHVPGLAAYVAPLLDVEIGLVWAAPWLAAGAIVALVGGGRESGEVRGWGRSDSLVATLALLALFAQTTNVNSGGTFGPSRYGLWLMPLALPVLARWRADSRLDACAYGLAATAVAWHVWVNPPSRPEDNIRHTRVAAEVLRRWPRAYRPLPEVFVERTIGVDGFRRLPVATDACDRLLLLGEGDGAVRWPIPCEPAPVVDACRAPGRLCYATRTGTTYAFDVAPAQSGWVPTIDRAATWSDADREAWRAVTGERPLRRVVPGTNGSLIIGAEGVADLRAVQSDGRMLAWVTSRDNDRATVRLSLGVPSRVELWDAESRPLRRDRSLGALVGEPWIDVGPGPFLIVVAWPP
ncbi:MAG: hypothetical protein U0Q12_18340 [Vicinamibacterales bacterium]